MPSAKQPQVLVIQPDGELVFKGMILSNTKLLYHNFDNFDSLKCAISFEWFNNIIYQQRRSQGEIWATNPPYTVQLQKLIPRN